MELEGIICSDKFTVSPDNVISNGISVVGNLEGSITFDNQIMGFYRVLIRGEKFDEITLYEGWDRSEAKDLYSDMKKRFEEGNYQLEPVSIGFKFP